MPYLLKSIFFIFYLAIIFADFTAFLTYFIKEMLSAFIAEGKNLKPEN